MSPLRKNNAETQNADAQVQAAMQQRSDAEKGTGKKTKASGVSNRTLFGTEKTVKNTDYHGKFKPVPGTKKAYRTVISIEPQNGVVRFASAKGESGKFRVDVKPYSARAFDKEFFTIFKQMLADYAKTNAAYTGKSATATVLLPNGMILSDLISIPSVGAFKMDKMVRVSIDGRYKNNKDLRLNYFPIVSNKQFTVYEISAMNQQLLQTISTSCAGNNIFANVITYTGSALANAAIAANPKLKSETFVLADIKEHLTRLCYVVEGSCMGSIDLPFGYSVLQEEKLVAENMLFDHSVAELAVLNAKEKAKAKQLTMAATAMQVDEELDEGIEAFGGKTEMSASNAVVYKTLPKKTPRVLPKFMQRPEPQTAEELRYENFRIFEKYILEYLRSNKNYNIVGAPSAVYFNMPDEYKPLLEISNQSFEENQIAFKAMEFPKLDSNAKANLEIYGATLAGSLNLQNNF